MRHDESKSQQAFVRWFRLAYPELAYMLIAVPNGARTSATQGRILKAEGMLAGVADILLLVARGGHGFLALEFKTKKGQQSDAQRVWQRECENNGNKYVVVRSVEEAIAAVEDYLKL